MWNPVTAIVGGVVVIFAVLYGVIFLSSYELDSYECRSRWDGSGYAVQYGLMSDCRVNVDGHLLPERAVRSLNR